MREVGSSLKAASLKIPRKRKFRGAGDFKEYTTYIYNIVYYAFFVNPQMAQQGEERNEKRAC